MTERPEDAAPARQGVPVAPVARPPGVDALTSGSYLSAGQAVAAKRCLIVALEHTAGQVDALADRLASLQATRGDFQPIVVVRSSSTHRLRFHGFLYERVMPPSQWERVAPVSDYPDHLSRRLGSIRDMYEPHVRVDLPGGAELTAQALEDAIEQTGAAQSTAGEGRR